MTPFTLQTPPVPQVFSRPVGEGVQVGQSVTQPRMQVSVPEQPYFSKPATSAGSSSSRLGMAMPPVGGSGLGNLWAGYVRDRLVEEGVIPSPSASSSASMSASASASVSPSLSASASPSLSPSPSISASPSISPSISASYSVSPSISSSISSSVSTSPSIVPSISSSPSP